MCSRTRILKLQGIWSAAQTGSCPLWVGEGEPIRPLLKHKGAQILLENALKNKELHIKEETANKKITCQGYKIENMRHIFIQNKNKMVKKWKNSIKFRRGGTGNIVKKYIYLICRIT